MTSLMCAHCNARASFAELPSFWSSPGCLCDGKLSEHFADAPLTVHSFKGSSSSPSQLANTPAQIPNIKSTLLSLNTKPNLYYLGPNLVSWRLPGGQKCPLRVNIYSDMISRILWKHMFTIASLPNKTDATEGCTRLTQECSYHYSDFIDWFGLAFSDMRYFPPLG